MNYPLLGALRLEMRPISTYYYYVDLNNWPLFQFIYPYNTLIGCLAPLAPASTLFNFKILLYQLYVFVKTSAKVVAVVGINLTVNFFAGQKNICPLTAALMLYNLQWVIPYCWLYKSNIFSSVFINFAPQLSCKR